MLLEFISTENNILAKQRLMRGEEKFKNGFRQDEEFTIILVAGWCEGCAWPGNGTADA